MRKTTPRDLLIDLLRRRTWAGWIDVLVLFVVGVILSIVSGNGHIGSWTTNDNGFVTQHRGASVNLTAGPFLASVAIALLYYFTAELMTGQTIGKSILGLKVISVNGEPLGVRPAPAYAGPNRQRAADLLSRRLDRDARTAQAAAATRRPPRRHHGCACLASVS